MSLTVHEHGRRFQFLGAFLLLWLLTTFGFEESDLATWAHNTMQSDPRCRILF